MRFFTCVLDLQGLGLGNRARQAYEVLPRRRGLHYEWQCFEGAAVLTGWDDPYGDPLVAQDGDWLAAGMVRLDNRLEVETCVHRRGTTATDLELILRVVARYGSEHVSKLLGDFAFVAWNGKTQSGVAACDAFAVQKIFYTQCGRSLSFASRAEVLAIDGEYDLQHLLALVSSSDRPPGSTAFRGVRQLPRASFAAIEKGAVRLHQYWSAEDFAMEPSWAHSEARIADECRTLLIASIRQRVARCGTIWAQLSGGIDSSSITSLTQWLAERGELTEGIAGTVTFVDHRGTSTDERAYSESVIERWGLRNEVIIDPPSWYDNEHSPPFTDHPRGNAHVYPREARMCAIIRKAGGHVLLTGVGGDQLFMGNMLYLADWVVHGRIRSAVADIAQRAAIGRVSFWEIAYRNAVLPLLPRAAHARLVHDQHAEALPPWLESRTLKKYGLDNHPATAPAYGGRWGRKYHHAAVSMVSQLECSTHGSLSGDALDVRHPMLYRPLVEFALRLPPELRARPHAHRWVLREAMRGILPERVRMRVGKPGTADFLAWSLSSQRARLAFLLQRPLLGELGILDPDKLRAAFNAALDGAARSRQVYGALFDTIATEVWLQTRSGRWARGIASSDRARGSSIQPPS